MGIYKTKISYALPFLSVCIIQEMYQIDKYLLLHIFGFKNIELTAEGGGFIKDGLAKIWNIS